MGVPAPAAIRREPVPGCGPFLEAWNDCATLPCRGTGGTSPRIGRHGGVVSLGNKLILFLTLPLILIMVLFGALSQMRSRDLIHRELLREGRAVVRVAQEAMEDYLRDHQLEDLRDLGNQLTGFERIVGVELFDRDGQVVYT